MSFIIPVYNPPEAVFKKCVQSVLNQANRNFELILVDDGSDNGTEELCDQYSLQCSKVHVVHQKNMGVSYARNIGMKMAQGDWLVFLDSDDSVSLNLTEELCRFVKNKREILDIIGFDMNIISSDGKTDRVHTMPFQAETCISDSRLWEMALDLLADGYQKKSAGAGFGSACCKIYRKAFFKGQNISFPEDLSIAEDMVFNLQCFLLKDCKVSYLQSVCYNRTVLSDSALHRYHPEILQNDRNLICHLQNMLVPFAERADVKEAFSKRFIVCMTGIIGFDMGNPDNPKGRQEKVRDLKLLTASSPYREAIKNVKITYLSKRERIFTILCRHHLEAVYLMLLKIRK